MISLEEIPPVNKTEFELALMSSIKWPLTMSQVLGYFPFAVRNRLPDENNQPKPLLTLCWAWCVPPVLFLTIGTYSFVAFFMNTTEIRKWSTAYSDKAR